VKFENLILLILVHLRLSSRRRLSLKFTIEIQGKQQGSHQNWSLGSGYMIIVVR